MTKFEAFRQAAAEMGDAVPGEMSAYIANRFGVVIKPQYIPLFRATLRYQKNGAEPEQSAGSACLPEVQ